MQENQFNGVIAYSMTLLATTSGSRLDGQDLNKSDIGRGAHQIAQV